MASGCDLISAIGTSARSMLERVQAFNLQLAFVTEAGLCVGICICGADHKTCL